MTPPKIVQLYDGPTSGIDESYQTSITSLSVSWMMVDKESGISEYQLAVYARVQGSTSKFFPTNAPFITLQPQEVGESGVLNCWTGDIQLSVGTLYTVRVVPINRAKLSTIYTSSGIIPDNTEPVIDFIHIGTYGDESEELTEENAVSRKSKKTGNILPGHKYWNTFKKWQRHKSINGNYYNNLK